MANRKKTNRKKINKKKTGDKLTRKEAIRIIEGIERDLRKKDLSEYEIYKNLISACDLASNRLFKISVADVKHHSDLFIWFSIKIVIILRYGHELNIDINKTKEGIQQHVWLAAYDRLEADANKQVQKITHMLKAQQINLLNIDKHKEDEQSIYFKTTINQIVRTSVKLADAEWILLKVKKFKIKV